MFYTKKIKFPKRNEIEIKISDFSKGLDTIKDSNLLEPDYSVLSYNFSFKNGALKECEGFNPLKMPLSLEYAAYEVLPNYPEDVEVLSLHKFKQYRSDAGRIDKLLLYCNDGKMYYSRIVSLNPTFRDTGIRITEKPKTINYKLNNTDFILVSTTTEGLYVYDAINAPQNIHSGPKISSLCVCGGRLFASLDGDRNIVRYSSNLDVTSWTEALHYTDGVIELNDERGSINLLVPFLNYVYVFRDYGISRISTNKNVEDLNTTVYQLFTAGNKIYGNTVCVCGNKIFMFCKDGIYQFDGSNTKKVNLKIDGLFDKIGNENSVAEYHNGKYYLACRLNFDDDCAVGCETATNRINNALIVLDTVNLEYEIIRGVDISSLASIRFTYFDKLLATFNTLNKTVIGELTGNGEDLSVIQTKKWVSPLSCLGYQDKSKFVKEISLYSKYDISLKIFSEREEKIIDIKGSEDMVSHKVGLTGKRIGFEIVSNTKYANISNLSIKVELLEYENN